MKATKSEWQVWCEGPHTLARAKALKDPENRRHALRFVKGPSATEQREIDVRQRAINATPQSLIDEHCQFDGFFRK